MLWSAKADIHLRFRFLNEQNSITVYIGTLLRASGRGRLYTHSDSNLNPFYTDPDPAFFFAKPEILNIFVYLQTKTDELLKKFA